MEEDKQYVVYFFGMLLAALLGVGLWQTPSIGGGIAWIVSGTIIFAFLVGNYLLFGYGLVKVIAVAYGISSLIAAFYGTFVTFQVLPASVYAIIIAMTVLGIYLTPGEPQRQVQHSLI